MADPDPIALTLKGKGVVLCATRDTDGKIIPVVVPATGVIAGGGGGGTVDQGAAGVASWKVVEDNSAAIKAAVEKIPAQGQALAAASTPVVLPTSQAAGALALQAQLPAALVSGRLSVAVGATSGLTDTELRATAVPVSGTFYQATQPVSGPLTDTELRATPVPVSGTLTATVTGVATSTIQTDGTQKSIVRGGAKGATAAADVTSTASGANHNAIDATLYDASGNRIVLPVDQLATSYIPVRLTGNGTTFTGAQKVEGLNAVGGSSAVNPVAVGGVVATTSISTVFWTDSSGRIMTVGAAASGSAVTGNPVLTGGSDGTNARTLELKASNPLAADYGLKTREIPLHKSVIKTTAGTPAASLVVRAGPCWLFDVFASNQTATAGYLTVYDLTSAPTHGAAATARKVIGRHIDTKTGADPFNFFEDFGGLYFATGCVIVIENAEDDANTNTTAAPTLAMNAMFVAGT